MGALVVDDAEFAFGIAHHHHRPAADLRREIVAGLFHLAFVADVDPGGAEDPLHLQLEDCRIGVELPVHAAGLEEAREVFGHAVSVTHGQGPDILSGCAHPGDQ